MVWPSASSSNFFKTFCSFYCQAHSALLIRWTVERMQPCILLCASVAQKWENNFPIPAYMIFRLLQNSLNGEFARGFKAKGWGRWNHLHVGHCPSSTGGESCWSSRGCSGCHCQMKLLPLTAITYCLPAIRRHTQMALRELHQIFILTNLVNNTGITIKRVMQSLDMNKRAIDNIL